uniref:Uncharacterized protein n=1 Tax=Oryza glumipatula TaxID=40148 RepID=A0A0D9Z934_9ORYZ
MIIATLSSPPSTRDYSACAISAAHPASAAFNPSPQRQILKSDALSQASSLPPPLRHDCLRLIREYHVQILLKAQFFILFIRLLSLVVSGGPGCMDGRMWLH